jgi:hypothetical protein
MLLSPDELTYMKKSIFILGGTEYFLLEDNNLERQKKRYVKEDFIFSRERL